MKLITKTTSISRANPSDTNWDAIWGRNKNRSLIDGPSTRTRIRLARKILKQYAKKGDSILDVGCGSGALLGVLLREGIYAKLTGVDIANQPLEFARKQYPVCVFHLLDVQKEKLQEKFDIIVSLAALDIIADDKVALMHMSEMLQSGGYCVVSVQSNPAYWSALDNLRAYRRYTTHELEEKCARFGLQKVQAFQWGWPIYHWYYKILERYDTRLWSNEAKGVVTRLGASVLYVLFFLDDFFIFLGKGRQLFVVFQKK
ncbi:MAG: class I SAM-dependent methyltransferase [Patescibacteria group bacterium]